MDGGEHWQVSLSNGVKDPGILEQNRGLDQDVDWKVYNFNNVTPLG